MKETTTKKIKKKPHRHTWRTDYNDCSKCGGYEMRSCATCYSLQEKLEGKWEEV